MSLRLEDSPQVRLEWDVLSLPGKSLPTPAAGVQATALLLKSGLPSL